jgi:hypothetical protein
MFEFLRRYYERGRSDEIGGLLGGLSLLPGGDTADPAYRSDWEESVRTVVTAERTAEGYRQADLHLQ